MRSNASGMRLALALVVLGLGSGGCGTADPPSTAAPRQQTDAELKAWLKRADAVTPANPPDAQQPTPAGEPPPIVIVDGRRPGETPRAPWYGGSPDRGTSDVDKMTRQAEQMFWYRVSAVAQRLNSLDNLRAQQRAACSGSNTVTYGANSSYRSNGVPAGASTSIGSSTYVLDNQTSAQCRSVTGNLAYQESLVRREQDQIEIDSQRAGIYPGIIRDLYRRAGVR
jgi:hypothetical protein